MAEHEFHELCLLFPSCTDTELKELCKDIKVNGLQTPITLYEGKILDGRNRMMACNSCGVVPRYKEYTGDDPLGFVISKNMCRRHLSESQRAMVAAKLLEYRSANVPMSQRQVAESLNVSERSVRNALRVREGASPETVDAVECGTKTVHAAVNEMRQSQLNEDQPPSVDTDEDISIKTFRRSILKHATIVKNDMDKLFQITKWSAGYKEIYKRVQDIIFGD
jgi:predicted transcriptional regulator